MKKILIALALLLSATAVHAQTYKFYQTDNIHNQLRLNTLTGEVYQIQDDGQTFLVHPITTPDSKQPERYVLYKTQNMWTYILLDSFTGKLWQCQYSVEGTEYISSWVINPHILHNNNSKYSIQPMTSMYQYYLVNEETGDMWKFQWSTKEDDDYRWIEKFEPEF